MTHSQRLQIADQYLAYLDEGRIEALTPILRLAETDAELADLIVALSRGFSEEEGRTFASENREHVEDRLAEIAIQAAAQATTRSEDNPLVLEPTSSAKPATRDQTSGPAGGRTFLVVAKDESGKTMSQAAADLDGTVNLFTDLNAYPHHPDSRVSALRLIACNRNQTVHGIPVEVSRDAMENNNPYYSAAAFAEGKIDESVPTFEEILEDSDMTPDQQARWRTEAERLVREGVVIK